MSRILSFWISPVVAALLAGFVMTTLGFAWWLRVPAESGQGNVRLGNETTNVFPSVPTAPAVTGQKPSLAVMGDIALIGTVLPKNSEGAKAVLRINGRPFVLEEGKEIVDGLRLEKVRAQSVQLASKDGVRELEMASVKTAAVINAARPSTAPTPTIPTRITLTAGCNATPAQRKDGIILGSELLAGALQNSSGLVGLLNAASGKLVVQNSAGIGALIGLRDGDVLRSADGKPLTQASDLVVRVLQPVSQAQAVVVEITRDSAPQVLTFLPPGCRG